MKRLILLTVLFTGCATDTPVPASPKEACLRLDEGYAQAQVALEKGYNTAKAACEFTK